LTSTNGPEAIRAAQYMQQLFQNVGMKVTTASLSFPPFL